MTFQRILQSAAKGIPGMIIGAILGVPVAIVCTLMIGVLLFPILLAIPGFTQREVTLLLAAVTVASWAFCVYAGGRIGTTVVRERQPLSLHCVDCDYDLRGNVSRACPECGRPMSSEQWELLQKQPQQKTT